MANGYQTKNYQTPGGEELHIGGKLVIEGDGTVEGLPFATDTESGGVIADAKTEAETLEAKIDENGKLWVPAYTLPAAGEALGGVLQMPVQADSVAADVAGVVTDFNALLAKLRTAGILATAE